VWEAPLDQLEAARLLIFSGGLSILFASLLGAVMLIPLQPWGKGVFGAINFKQLLAAHLDWVMLGLMQGLAGALIMVFALAPSSLIVWFMVMGGWLNPLPYLFRAFGINAFALTGSLTQRAAASLGGLSATMIIIAWAVLLWGAWQAWQ
jgi:hypothetical protein